MLTALLFCSLFHPGEDLLALYQKADKLFNLDNPTEVTDSIALKTFGQVIQLLEKNPHDSLLFQCWLKTGVLLDVNTRFNDAKEAYLKAIGVHTKNNRLPDSTLFLPYVYAGTAYYHINNFDSADYFLLQAESISNKFPRVPEKDRMYNALGALYYENGNYVQSRNYFNRALEIIRSERPGDRASAIHFEGNIAASNYRLGLYQQSLTQYENLLKQRMYTSQISVNMGKAYTLTGDYASAMKCFRRVDPREVPGVYNEMANTQLLSGNLDSAGFYLDKINDRFSRLDVGVNYIFRGDLLAKQGKFREALKQQQKAITILSGNFNDNDIEANPTDFTGSFASYKLFDALFRKARTFEKYAEAEKKSLNLVSAYHAYQSTINLLRYIEKNYDTDDAKIFLKQNSQEVYNKAFSACIHLRFIDDAFSITEKNKASIVAARLTENRLKKMRGIDPALLQEERNIKYNIARLNIKSEATQDKNLADSIALEKEHFEIELSRLQKKIEQNSSYYKLKYADNFPDMSEISRNVTDRQAVVSFYTTGSVLHLFIMAKRKTHYVQIDSLPFLKQMTEQWITQLRNTETGRRFNGGNAGEILYERIIKPIQKVVGDKDEWLLIPDDIFHYLPFESLPTGEGPLLEKTAISYHFSTRFLIPQDTRFKSSYNILSMAPFSARAFQPMDRLPGSANEIAGLPGKQFTDSLATKEQFLQDINRYPIVHLATHAVADVNNSSNSYIAFYPGKGLPAEDNLYLDELYGLNMDSTDLVIISACETGTGQLISSEGVLSLSRGFTYAGCNSVINSLWKADDAATATILKQFHIYLQEGYGKSKALQKAKLDYIHSNAGNTSPNYWSHLMLIGDTKPVVQKKSAGNLWYYLGLPALLITIVAYVKTKKKRS